MSASGEPEWTTSLFPKDGGYLLPIKDAVREAEGMAGDIVQVEMAIRHLRAVSR